MTLENSPLYRSDDPPGVQWITHGQTVVSSHSQGEPQSLPVHVSTGASFPFVARVLQAPKLDFGWITSSIQSLGLTLTPFFSLAVVTPQSRINCSSGCAIPLDFYLITQSLQIVTYDALSSRLFTRPVTLITCPLYNCSLSRTSPPRGLPAWQNPFDARNPLFIQVSSSTSNSQIPFNREPHTPSRSRPTQRTSRIHR